MDFSNWDDNLYPYERVVFMDWLMNYLTGVLRIIFVWKVALYRNDHLQLIRQTILNIIEYLQTRQQQQFGRPDLEV